MGFVKIDIQPDTRRLLSIMKAKDNFRSYDDAIRHILAFYIDPVAAQSVKRGKKR